METVDGLAKLLVALGPPTVVDERTPPGVEGRDPAGNVCYTP
jgi:hypothetical protein